PPATAAECYPVRSSPSRKWRNWQTHQLEGLAFARTWGFESPLPHQRLTGAETPEVVQPRCLTPQLALTHAAARATARTNAVWPPMSTAFTRAGRLSAWCSAG